MRSRLRRPQLDAASARVYADALRLVATSADADLKALHDEFLSRKSGAVTALLKTLGTLPPEDRREFGALVNALKTEIEAALDERRAALAGDAAAGRQPWTSRCPAASCRSAASTR